MQEVVLRENNLCFGIVTPQSSEEGVLSPFLGCFKSKPILQQTSRYICDLKLVLQIEFMLWKSSPRCTSLQSLRPPFAKAVRAGQVQATFYVFSFSLYLQTKSAFYASYYATQVGLV